MKFGIGLGISNKILVGNLNKKGDMFLNKEDKTLEAVNAVIELIKYNDSKNMTTEIRDSKKRYILSFQEIETKQYNIKED